MKKGSLSINSENIFPVIKKWLYSDHDIFVRELISNGCDAVTKLKKLSLMRAKPKLTVAFFNTDTMIRETREMYIDGFKTSLAHDTSKKGLWKVSFDLNEY